MPPRIDPVERVRMTVDSQASRIARRITVLFLNEYFFEKINPVKMLYMLFMFVNAKLHSEGLLLRGKEVD